ncbi:UDP-N-acetylmuramoyl-tripeptide--D-alanyl-D-alanine ligase [Caldanaerobius polysaccharolyticus]|uniref:UDP-N-acetylmuramoyl-tripeptide--D-alanyl-D- alanine ligase n=1 Tax=Caldanaerobius polysaccharolyticus TaxID=44256 RepID=UPI00047A1255|nr:UDP-N-acetylmuramoyl-tripeptide--D-alanyl-D-alanine ligase [Caldanaerobius polysaccharolyticus]
MLSIEDIIMATGGKLISGTEKVDITGVSTDSRTVKKGDLFVPLKGQTFDGHDFIGHALNSGAVAALTAKELTFHTDKAIVLVDDTLSALQNVAKYHRERFDHLKVIGVTGSTGKTTTKEMIYAVLRKRFNVLKTVGNFNNQIGLPLTLLNLNESHDIAVVEMGMSSFGEIRALKDIAKPDIAVYTNIGISHIEKLGSRENILKAKLEMVEDFNKDNWVVLNADDDMLFNALKGIPGTIVTYGVNRGDIKATDIKQADKLCFKVAHGNESVKDVVVELSAYGMHNVYNALAAIAVGLIFDISLSEIAAGLKDYTPEKMRLNVVKANGIVIIDDCYNASPDSMRAAVDVLSGISKGDLRTIAVLGDMKELGDYSVAAHRDVGEYVHKKGIDILLCVGTLAEYIGQGAVTSGMEVSNIYKVRDNREAIGLLKRLLKRDDVVLVKGSRAMKMEEIVNFLRGEEICSYLCS